MKKGIFKRIFTILLIINSISSVFAIGAFAMSDAEYIADTIAYKNGNTTEKSIEELRDDVKVSSRFYELFFGKKKKEKSERYLCVSGEAFGIKLQEPYVTVSEAKEGSALRRGDRILSIENVKTESIENIKEALKASNGKPLKITIIRCGEKMTLTVTPTEDDGEYRLGIKLRAEASGIGTITYIDPETMEFGGLGHGVTDYESGDCIKITSGKVCDVALGKVVRGEAGKPGELSGVLGKNARGIITKNTDCGVFGTLSDKKLDTGLILPVATRSEVKCGEAEIISTVRCGKSQKFKIEICEIDSSSTGSKSFKIKVTDKTLITLTGGIVRGMSGSPIIQNGKLVGAVTHVMVANPTEGYGIFIENMLSAAEMPMAKAS